MLTHTRSTIELERPTLQTQVGGNGNGGIITAAFSTTKPEDDEPRTAVLEAEAYLLRQRINHLLIVTDHWNDIIPPQHLREQRGHATLAIFGEEGGAM